MAKTSQGKIKKFLRYNFAGSNEPPKFHDNDLRSIRILPSTNRKKTTTANIEFVFFERRKSVTKSVKRILILKGCANLQFSMDFDVLAANASSPNSSAGQTSNIEMSECGISMQHLIKQSKTTWNVEYFNKNTPSAYKLSRLREFILVKIILHGGTLEILARDFEISEQL